MGERLVIGENSKISTFKHELEMTERRVGSQELMVEGGVFLLGIGELLGVEKQKSPGTVQEMLQNLSQVGVEGIHGERDESIRSRMNKFWNGGEKILGSGEGRVNHRGPGEGLPRTLESICERGKYLGCTPEKLLV